MEQTRRRLEQRIDQALGDAPADLVIRNARTLNLVTGDLDDGYIAVCDDIVGTRDTYRGETEIDARGKIIVSRSSTAMCIVKARWSRLGNSIAACCRTAPPPPSATHTRSPMCLVRMG